MIFSVPTVLLTQKSRKLSLTRQESNDLQIPTYVPVLFFILDLFLREKFLEFIVAISKVTYFIMLVEEILPFLVWNLRVQFVF
jgi:hypothetical protein